MLRRETAICFSACGRWATSSSTVQPTPRYPTHTLHERRRDVVLDAIGRTAKIEHADRVAYVNTHVAIKMS